MSSDIDLFNVEFPPFYETVKGSLESYYERKEFMPELTSVGKEAILSTVTSCLSVGYHKEREFKSEVHSLCWKAAYIAVMMATKQVFKNGNKRMSLILLYFYLYCNDYEILFEGNYYSEWVRDMIGSYEKESGFKKEQFREVAINSLTLDCLDRAIPLKRDNLQDNIITLSAIVKDNFRL